MSGYATNPKDSESRITEVDQFSPGLSREYLIKGFDDKDVQAYFKLMVDMAVLLGADDWRWSPPLKKCPEVCLSAGTGTAPCGAGAC